MKASQLREELLLYIDKYGDVDVLFEDGDMILSNVNHVGYSVRYGILMSDAYIAAD